MGIDFRIMSKGLVNSGLVFEIVPGLPTDVLAREKSIFFGEDAFGFIEPCVADAWPEYRNFGHWGESIIPTDCWRKIVDHLLFVAEEVKDAGVPADIKSIGFVFAETREYFYENFHKLRDELLNMIHSFVTWVSGYFASASHITIVGI